jgi:N5-(cytidine 5'-diphosphoramidyl)-L-glutamine hydrolase
MAGLTTNPTPHRWRMGITQRRIEASDTAPARDALDAAWSDWFAAALPQVHFLPIPNFARSAQALAFVRDWQLDALLLSGGDDVGSSPVRDAVEHALLEHAGAHRWPVLGICRGMQLLHRACGGQLSDAPAHRAMPHPVHADACSATVNSWHRWSIAQVTRDWRVLASAGDGSVEAMAHRQLPWLGLMWHPERGHSGMQLCRPWLAEILGTTPAPRP